MQSEARRGRVISCQSNYSLFCQIILGEFEYGHFSCSCCSSEDCAAVICEFLSLISALLSLPLISMCLRLLQSLVSAPGSLCTAPRSSGPLTGLSSHSKVPKLCPEPGMCSKTFNNFLIQQEIASILPSRVFPERFALLALAAELCTKAGPGPCWAWHPVLELCWSWEMENQDFEGQGLSPGRL